MKRTGRRFLKRLVFLFFFLCAFFALFITNFFYPLKYLTAYMIFSPDVADSGVLRVRYLDVGYGDCIFIELPDGKTMLIDGGVGTYSQTHNLLKTLNKSKKDNIDYLVCTSVNSEHCGGLYEVAKYKEVGTAYIPYVADIYLSDEYARFYKEVSSCGADIKIAEYGAGEAGDGYFFTFLSPDAHTLDDSRYNRMNLDPSPENIRSASAVLWLQFGEYGFMFLGDAPCEVQRQIAESLILEGNFVYVGGKMRELAPCYQLKVANHGGADSADEELLDLLSPETAIISVGANTKGAPSVYETATLYTFVKEIYRTDADGPIRVEIDGTPKISKEKI